MAVIRGRIGSFNSKRDMVLFVVLGEYVYVVLWKTAFVKLN